MTKIKISDIVGQTIEDIIPCDDYAIVVLSNGKEFDLGIDPSEIKQPNNPEEVRKIRDLEDKLYDATYGEKEDKNKQIAYKKQIKELMDSLVGTKLSFAGKPCSIRGIADYKEYQVLIEQENRTKVVKYYNLEK